MTFYVYIKHEFDALKILKIKIIIEFFEHALGQCSGKT